MLNANCPSLLVCQLCESRDSVLLSILFTAVSLAPGTEYPELCAWHITVVNKYLLKEERWKEGKKGGQGGGKDGRRVEWRQ